MAPMWPWFDSQTWLYMWVEFVVSSHPCSEVFLQVLQVLPSSSKTNTSKFQLDPEAMEIRATLWISTDTPIYLLIYFI